ncbi:MAG: cyanophycinase [Ginsengibacter sp.]
MRHLIIIHFIFFSCFASSGQNTFQAKGKLFIIGGGNRSASLIVKMIETARLNKKDHIAILPMASEQPDSSYFYIKTQLEKFCGNTIANLNFIPDKINNQQWLDSLKNAKLIFITGGDQSRFTKLVLRSPVHHAIDVAYKNGSTIGGTSAGAAVMSKHMITGNQLLGDTSYAETFNKLWNSNIEFTEGLGLLSSVIIDQHFIARSRYNRLLSALAKFPNYTCIGIDESTAIIVYLNKVRVIGEGQVVKLCCPKKLPTKKSNALIKFQDARLSIYISGDSFELK